MERCALQRSEKSAAVNAALRANCNSFLSAGLVSKGMVAEEIMESIADLLGEHQGERIEVTTNASQLMAGSVGEIYADYFALLSITRVYFVPYTGISSFQFPLEPGSQQAEKLAAQQRAFVSQTPAKQKQRVLKRSKA